jgi:hypothetical protein
MENNIFAPSNTTYLTINNCDLGYARSGIIYFYTALTDNGNITIQDSTFHHAGININSGDKDWPDDDGYSANRDCHAIGHQGDTDDVSITGNTFYYCGTAIETHTDENLDGFDVSRNYFYYCGGKYLDFDDSGSSYKCSTSGRSVVISGSTSNVNTRTNHTVTYNKFWDCQGMIGTNQSSEMGFYNNTGVTVGEGFAFLNVVQPLKALFKNNIVMDIDTSHPAAFGATNSDPQFVNFDNGDVAAGYITSNTNYFYDTGSAGTFTFDTDHQNEDSVNLTTWAAAANHGDETSESTGDVNADPELINTTDSNLKLQIGSPCIDAGTDVSLTQDYDGNEVPRGTAPDIGAFEYIPKRLQ